MCTNLAIERGPHIVAIIELANSNDHGSMFHHVSPTGLCVMALPQIIRVMNDHDLALKETVTWGSPKFENPPIC